MVGHMVGVHFRMIEHFLLIYIFSYERTFPPLFSSPLFISRIFITSRKGSTFPIGKKKAIEGPLSFVPFSRSSHRVCFISNRRLQIQNRKSFSKKQKATAFGPTTACRYLSPSMTDRPVKSQGSCWIYLIGKRNKSVKNHLGKAHFLEASKYKLSILLWPNRRPFLHCDFLSDVHIPLSTCSHCCSLPLIRVRSDTPCSVKQDRARKSSDRSNSSNHCCGRVIKRALIIFRLKADIGSRRRAFVDVTKDLS